jgi:hypothetical protein
MPDELDALRHFRDETPGPSTDAWNRARAAIAAARAEEQSARRRHNWIPGRRPRRRGPVSRRVLGIAAGCAVAAAVAVLLAVLLPNSPATRGTGAEVETTAFVTHVEHALSPSGQRNLVGYARSVYPPGTSVEPLSPGVVRIMAGRGASSPWTVGYLVRWSYESTTKVSAFTAAGHRVFGLEMTPVHGMLTSTAVFYRSGTWWRGTIGPATAGNGPAPVRCVPGIQIGPGGWPAFLSHALSCGEYTKGGHRRIGGIDAIELTGGGGGTVIWVNPQTYLPVRATLSIPGGARIQTDFDWLAPTRARLAQLRVLVPPGFRQVPAPAQHGPALVQPSAR